SHSQYGEFEASQSSAATYDNAEVPQLLPSGAQTNMMVVDELARMMRDVPPMFRADGTPMPPFKFSEASMMPAGQDLASVVGGHTMTGHTVAPAVEPERSGRWTILILAIAALIGIGAAVAFHLKPSASELSPGQETAAPTTPAPTTPTP